MRPGRSLAQLETDPAEQRAVAERDDDSRRRRRELIQDLGCDLSIALVLEPFGAVLEQRSSFGGCVVGRGRLRLVEILADQG